jgi:rhodanese-related sulfurtransferase
MRQFSYTVSFILLLLGATLTADAQESSLTVEGATTISADMAKALHDRGVPFVDVRTDDLFEAAHIPGATHLELFNAFDEPNLLKAAAKDKEVVIYCAGPGCKRSSKACIKAVSWGFKKVYYFRGGFPAWRAAGLPTDPP